MKIRCVELGNAIRGAFRKVQTYTTFKDNLKKRVSSRDSKCDVDLSLINIYRLSKAEHFSLIVLLLVSSSKPETGVSVGDRK